MKKPEQKKECICKKKGFINLKCPVHIGTFKIDEKWSQPQAKPDKPVSEEGCSCCCHLGAHGHVGSDCTECEHCSQPQPVAKEKYLLSEEWYKANPSSKSSPAIMGVSGRQGEEEWEKEFDNLFRFKDKYTFGEIKDFISSHKKQWEQQARAERDEELREKIEKSISFFRGTGINKPNERIQGNLDALEDILSFINEYGKTE